MVENTGFGLYGSESGDHAWGSRFDQQLYIWKFQRKSAKLKGPISSKQLILCSLSDSIKQVTGYVIGTIATTYARK